MTERQMKAHFLSAMHGMTMICAHNRVYLPVPEESERVGFLVGWATMRAIEW